MIAIPLVSSGTMDDGQSQGSLRDWLLPLAFAIFIVGTAFKCDAHVSLGNADEGFLWDGVNRVREGQVPCRDFQSYAPLRYYWCFVWAEVFGRGIVGVRAGSALFQVVGVFLGILIARRMSRRPVWLLYAGGLLYLWLAPRFRVFDVVPPLVALYAGVRLTENFGRWEQCCAGCVVGVALFAGHNHAMYIGAGLAGLTAYLCWQRRFEGTRAVACSFAAGLAVGLLPIALMCILPGFVAANMEWVRRLMWSRSTNISLPIPWPWLTALSGPKFSCVINWLLVLGSCYCRWATSSCFWSL